ncbi:uncharacterized protein LOC124358811 [Homalodisca vitripennis]|nr:uncharacterized protein LOC124358811 [Homalodisca vitripennis]
MDDFPVYNQQDVCDLNDEKTSITGGKSVSEIVQLLRTKAKLKISKGLEDSEDVDDQPSKSNQVFPWMNKFTALCKEVILEPNIKKLDELITQFLKYIGEDVKQCYNKPKRAYKLRTRMNVFMVFFHMMYWEIKRPLEHTSYLDKMSDLLAHYIDVEMKSSRRGREHPKKISERICTSLYLFLDKSPDHILDTVLKAKFFVKKYSDICVPVMARLLNDNPGQVYETTYVRYLLSFKLWKKLAGKEHYVNINKEAVAKLKPPPDFAEKLKSGLFSNVLPYVSKSEKDRITLFFMQSPFNVKKKAQLFLKDGRKVQPTGDLEKAFLFEEDFNLNNLFIDDSQDDENNPDLMNEIWGSIMESDPESVCLDDLFSMENSNEDDKIIIDLENTKSKEKTRKVSKEKTNGVLKGPTKKRKSVKFSSCVSVKNVLNKESSELIRTDKPKSLIPVTSKEDSSFSTLLKLEESLKKEDKPSLSSSQCSDPQKPQKPCATVEPEQCKELEPDSRSKNTNVIHVKSPQKISFNSLETVNRAKDDQLKSNSENSVRSLILNTDHNISSVASSEVEVVPSEVADSSGICEEIKVETNPEEMFVVSDLYKDIKGDEVPIEEDQLVAQEVVIRTEMSQEDMCPRFVVMDENGQSKLDEHDIMNVISISKDPAMFGSDSVIINSSAWKRSQDKQEVQTEIVSLLENQNSVSGTIQPKGNSTKEQSSVSPENHQFLSSIVASSESNDNYVSFDRRHDSYIYNDYFLTRLFSEVNGDDGSDDDNRCNNRSRYAGGGKIPAFREQSEESKSDGGEEFESPSPASRSDSQRSTVEASPEMNNTQPTNTDLMSQEYDVADKSPALVLTQPIMVSEQKSPSPPLREVCVSLPYISGSENLNDYVTDKEKICPKAKQSTSRQPSSHHKRKRAEKIVEEQEPSESDDDDVPLFCLEEQAEEIENKSSKEKSRRIYNKTRSASSSRSKSKSSQPPPTVGKPPPQVVKKKRRSRRKR